MKNPKLKAIYTGMLGGGIFTLLSFAYDLKADTELLIWKYLIQFIGFGFVMFTLKMLSLREKSN